jgi:YVTN family beta-propeller protein
MQLLRFTPQPGGSAGKPNNFNEQRDTMEEWMKKIVGHRARQLLARLVLMLWFGGLAIVLNAQKQAEAFDDPMATRKNIDGPVLLVANKHSNTLSFVNPKTLKVIETIPTGPNPHEITVTPDQRFAYLSNYAPPGNTISVVDLHEKKMIKEISTGQYTRIHGAAMAPDGRHAYFTAGQSGYVVEVDTRTNEVTRGIPTHGKISHTVYVSPDGKHLYTGNIVSENISVIDRLSGKLIGQIPAGEGCEGMAFTPDGKHLWAANQTGGTITIIDLITSKPIETFQCPGMPVRIRFTHDGKLALVSSWTKTGELVVIDVATRRELKRIRVGDFAIGVELSPDGSRAFVGCEDSMEAEVLPDGSERVKAKAGDSDGVHVIDMTTLSVESVIKTGLGPDPMVMWYP